MGSKKSEALEYTPKRLNQIYKECLRKIRSGSSNQMDQLMGAAAGYALDFLEISKDSGYPLDLTARTEDKVEQSLSFACGFNQENGKSVSENRRDLTKKFASYQLFSIVNSCNYEKKKVEIAILSMFVSGPCLVIRTTQDFSGNQRMFNTFQEAEETIKKMYISDERGDDKIVLAGTLKPFYDHLAEFVKKIDGVD